MDLTTLARVKLLLQPQRAPSTSLDSSISQIITSVSRGFEMYIDREIEWIARTEDFDVEENRNRYILRAWPARTAAGAFTNIASVTVYNDIQMETGSYTQFPSTTEVSKTQYAVDSRNGFITFTKDAYLQCGPRSLRVTYTGGFNSTVGTTTATFVTAYPDIAGACEREVIRIYQSSQNPEASSVQTGGGSLLFIPPARFLATTEAVLDHYKRPALG